jgi:putative nucleotidyltransferase with HDIG domain
MDPAHARTLLEAHVANVNLRRHCIAVAAVMRALAAELDGDPDVWESLGYIHDADWEQTKDNPALHTVKTLEWLQKAGVTDPALIHALQSHNRKLTHLAELEGVMEWALETCDELTGFIVAVALVRPDPPSSLDSLGTSEGQVKSRLQSVTVESVMRKWGKKEFAKAVDRSQIEQCEEKLEIPLHEFIQLTLNVMKQHHQELGL